jgi:DNA polymerase-1
LPPILPKGELAALDTELFGMEKKRLHRPGGTLACLSVCVGDDVWQVYSEKDIAAAMRRMKLAEQVWQKGDFDFRQLRARGIPVKPDRYWDTMYVEQCLFNNYYSHFGLDSLSRRWLQRQLDKESRELFYEADRMTREMQRYAARDAWTTYHVAQAQKAYVKGNRLDGLVERSWYETDMPMVWVVQDMMGVCIDQGEWGRIADEQEAIMERSLSELDYNPGSPKDVGARLVAEGIRLPKTKTGQPSTAEEHIAPYADKSETVRQVLEYRGAQKFAGTYGRNFFAFVEADKRIHAGWIIIGTETFRLACELPNLQNIPKRDAVWGPRYRRAFIPAKGNAYVKTDYVQCQVAVMAQVSDDKPFKEAFENHLDVHTANASWMFGVSIGEVTPEQRRAAKGTTFGIIFNEGAGLLAANVGTTRRKAQEFIDGFMRTHWGYAQWKREQLRSPDDFVTGPGGHRIWVNPYVGKHADNNRLNSPIQEGEGAIHKRAAWKLHEKWNPAWGPFGLALLVHDEMVVEVPRAYAKACARLVEQCALEAEREVLPDVRPAADVEICKNWYGDKA